MTYSRYERTCERCGQNFLDDRVSKPGRFCSRSCANRSTAKTFDQLQAESTEATNGCLVWAGFRNPHGYGVFAGEFAHRLAWVKAYGAIPKLKIVRHRCNNPPCIRPSHLRIGSHEDNVADRVEWARSARGERQGLAKLSAVKVRKIRKSVKSNAQLAEIFGVSKTAIRLARIGKTWKHVS